MNVLDRTRDLWNTQHRLVGDRIQLFTAVAEAVEATTVLYPGSYVDLTPAVVWPAVTFVDVDRRANRFFSDADGIRTLLSEQGADPDARAVEFLHADYTEPLDLADNSFDLLISLYAGFVSEHCTRHLRVGGHLLVAPSHGDAAMASIDPRYELHGVLTADHGAHRVSTTDLESYLVPKRDIEVTADLLHRTGRGIDYTRSPFAYLFVRRA